MDEILSKKDGNMKPETCPILEFDPDREAILNPERSRRIDGLPKRAVLCFFREVLLELVEQGKLRQVSKLISEMGDNPIYVMEHEGQQITVIASWRGGSSGGRFFG